MLSRRPHGSVHIAAACATDSSRSIVGTPSSGRTWPLLRRKPLVTPRILAQRRWAGAARCGLQPAPRPMLPIAISLSVAFARGVCAESMLPIRLQEGGQALALGLARLHHALGHGLSHAGAVQG